MAATFSFSFGETLFTEVRPAVAKPAIAKALPVKNVRRVKPCSVMKMLLLFTKPNKPVPRKMTGKTAAIHPGDPKKVGGRRKPLRRVYFVNETESTDLPIRAIASKDAGALGEVVLAPCGSQASSLDSDLRGFVLFEDGQGASAYAR
jgi:hypothetical protein